jgi:hypothetical protein
MVGTRICQWKKNKIKMNNVKCADRPTKHTCALHDSHAPGKLTWLSHIYSSFSLYSPFFFLSRKFWITKQGGWQLYRLGKWFTIICERKYEGELGMEVPLLNFDFTLALSVIYSIENIKNVFSFAIDPTSFLVFYL